MSVIKAEHRENHVMLDLTVVVPSIENRKLQTMNMSIDNTVTATVLTAIIYQICKKSTESFNKSSLMNYADKSDNFCSCCISWEKT